MTDVATPGTHAMAETAALRLQVQQNKVQFAIFQRLADLERERTVRLEEHLARLQSASRRASFVLHDRVYQLSQMIAAGGTTSVDSDQLRRIQSVAFFFDRAIAGTPRLAVPILDDFEEDSLAQLVRDIWIAWAQTQPDVADHPNWLTPWEELSERDREVDRWIAYGVAKGYRELALLQYQSEVVEHDKERIRAEIDSRTIRTPEEEMNGEWTDPSRPGEIK